MEKDYNISFFKPKNEFSKKNRNLVFMLVMIWAIAVFGFQILLKVIEKPVPEKTLTEFNSVIANVYSSTASNFDKQVYLKSMINLVNKNTINKVTEKPIIIKAINWAFYSLIEDKNAVSSKIYELEKRKETLSEISNFDEYKEEKILINNQAKDLIYSYKSDLSIERNDIRAEILFSVLSSNNSVVLSNQERELLPTIITKYMVHNRSVLTDTSFLGFPFHYFYTAVFLLILFVGLCYIYARQIEKMNKQFGIVE